MMSTGITLLSLISMSCCTKEPREIGLSIFLLFSQFFRLASFIGIANSFDQYPREWHAWYQSGEPENTPLPGEWENSCNELQRMLIVRSLRPDRVPFCVTTFIINNLDAKSVDLLSQPHPLPATPPSPDHTPFTWPHPPVTPTN